MADLNLSQLADTLTPAAPPPGLTAQARLRLPQAPDPFVPPPLTADSGEMPAEPLGAEVIIVSSPAAVGKSTAARHLAAIHQLPLLDLAATRVSTRTFAGLFASDFADSHAALRSFHAGQLPVIVDALDEGRLRSGDANFDEFLETTWELLLEDRSVMNHPKLVLFGRDVAAELVDLSLQLAEASIRTSWLRLDFFGSRDAPEVIEAHAAASAREHGRTWDATSPSRDVIEAFFSAIGAALSLEPEDLWGDAHGRALCGYAPVLAAIGRLLERETNPIRLKNALHETGAERAWSVIERVAGEILDRERDEKLWPPLQQELSVEVPAEAYDRHEQLTYLVDHACGRPVQPTRRVTLDGNDAQTYRRMLDQLLAEHPFLQAGKLANGVLASLVLAHAVANELLQDQDLELLRRWSRQPFLWRSLQRYLEDDPPQLLLGQYVGPVLNSLWNDAAADDPLVTARDDPYETGFLRIRIQGSDGEWELQTLPPLELYEQALSFDFDGAAPLTLQGHQEARGVASFDMGRDVTTVVRDTLTISAAAIRVDGNVRIYAERVAQPGYLIVTSTENSRTWFGGALDELVPWRDLPKELPPPIEVRPASELERFVEQCAKRIPNATPIVVYRGSFIPGDHRKMKWTEHDSSGDRLPDLLRLFEKHGFARPDSLGASGPDPKVRLHFDLTWGDFLKALRDPPTDGSKLLALVAEARDLFGETGGSSTTAAPV